MGIETGGAARTFCALSATSCEEIQNVQGWQHELYGVCVFSECVCVLLFWMHPNVCVLLFEMHLNVCVIIWDAPECVCYYL